ncbi:uncharacterized protein RJT21DRAFT_122360 [Scheffersomyces amazonensis]|uniref:uncharacterized protein n=1 Tax=Scheffersomyces amazonensis TaxID=1078765 RepID=UPI00315D8A8E
MSSSSDSIEELLSTGWECVNPKSTGTSLNDNEYIYIAQLVKIIEKLESVLSIKQLLTDDELKLLRNMIQTSPSMKLHRNQLKEFLLKMVHFDRFEIFLQTRFQISPGAVRIIVNKSTDNNNINNINNSNNNINIHDVNSKYKVNNNNNVENEQSRFSFQKQQLNTPPPEVNHLKLQEKNTEIQRLTTEISSLQLSLEIKDRRIRELDDELQTINKHVHNIEQQLRKRPEQRNTNDLLNRIKDKDGNIKSLQQLCNQYQKEIKELKNQQSVNKLQMNELIKNLNENDRLISNVQNKFKIENKIDSIILNLPFIKQYYNFFKYRKQQRNWGLVVINIITLILTTIILLNGLQFVLYVTLWFITSLSSKNQQLEYVYDNYGDPLFGLQSTFQWWKEIEWLEYLIYTIQDWYL